MSLIALQRDFHCHLVDAPIDAGSRHAIGTRSGLAVYHNAYRAQLADCLARTFEQTLAWLGGAAFADAARDHIAHTPPGGWTLAAYGAGFDHMLARLYPDDPEVAELAQLEWMLSKTFEGENADALSPGEIAGVDWDSAALAFVPTLVTWPALTNADAIWSALAAGHPPPLAAVLPIPATMLVWRQGFTPCFRVIGTVEHDAIIAMRAGATFAGLCGTLVDGQGEDAGLALVGRMLGQWFADGLVSKIHMKNM